MLTRIGGFLMNNVILKRHPILGISISAHFSQSVLRLMKELRKGSIKRTAFKALHLFTYINSSECPSVTVLHRLWL